jgi:hypothetical protein
MSRPYAPPYQVSAPLPGRAGPLPKGSYRQWDHNDHMSFGLWTLVWFAIGPGLWLGIVCCMWANSYLTNHAAPHSAWNTSGALETGVALTSIAFGSVVSSSLLWVAYWMVKGLWWHLGKARAH